MKRRGRDKNPDVDLDERADEDTGRFERPVGMEAWKIPSKVELREDRLVWSSRSFGREIEWGPGLLEDFIRLADGTDKAICNYAGHWGVLGLCDHDLPHTHKANDEAWELLALDTTSREDTDDRWDFAPRAPTCAIRATSGPRGAEYWEPASAWRKFAREARAMMRIASFLHRKEMGKPEDWQALQDYWSVGAFPRASHLAVSWVQSPYFTKWPTADEPLSWSAVPQDAAAIGIHRRLLARIVNRWQELGRVRPCLPWGFGEISSRLVLMGDGLMGALAIQLLMAVSGGKGLALCSSCGAPYMPKRRPNTKRRNYCLDCGRTAALRDAQQDRRTRKREATREA